VGTEALLTREYFFVQKWSFFLPKAHFFYEIFFSIFLILIQILTKDRSLKEFGCTPVLPSSNRGECDGAFQPENVGC